jgi:UDPglucose--hexose-1-phosphate uridylyltransferase
VKRTVTHLADGRELIYFDERDDASRDAVDQRELQPPPPASEMRHDPILDEWVAIAAHRQSRTFHPPSDQCPLCPSTPDWQSEIPAGEYDVVVFENRFPSFSHRVGPGQGAGRCEVVCFTPDHDSSFAALSPRRVRTVLEAWVDRTQALGALPETRQVYCFENRGEEIGVTLHHPHGQIYAFPFVGPKLAQMVTQAREYAAGHDGANLFDDMVTAEVAAGTRVVTRNEHWVVFVPEAARWPYEVRIFPLVRVPDLPSLDEAARDSFGPLYLDVLRRFDALFGRPAPYIAAWHQAPVGDPSVRDQFAAHLQVLSVRRAAAKLKYLAGTESGMGVWINDIVPEEAAQRLREA